MRAASALGGAVKEVGGAAANGKTQVDTKRRAADQRDKVKSLQEHRLAPANTLGGANMGFHAAKRLTPTFLQRTDLVDAATAFGRSARPWNQGRPRRCISGRHCEKIGPSNFWPWASIAASTLILLPGVDSVPRADRCNQRRGKSCCPFTRREAQSAMRLLGFCSARLGHLRRGADQPHHRPGTSGVSDRFEILGRLPISHD